MFSMLAGPTPRAILCVIITLSGQAKRQKLVVLLVDYVATHVHV